MKQTWTLCPTLAFKPPKPLIICRFEFFAIFRGILYNWKTVTHIFSDLHFLSSPDSLILENLSKSCCNGTVSSEGLKENRKCASFAEKKYNFMSLWAPWSLVLYVWIGYKSGLKTTYPPRFNVQNVCSLTREMFKLVSLKILKIVKLFWKKCVFKSSYPLTLRDQESLDTNMLR